MTERSKSRSGPAQKRSGRNAGAASGRSRSDSSASSGSSVSDGDGVLLPETRERILEGALEALGRHGQRRLGMSDVASIAGVSRGTLYRYFSSKEELFDSMLAYERERFEAGVNKALSAVPEGPKRIEAHIEFLTHYLNDHPAFARLTESEPRFVLSFLRDNLSTFRNATGSLVDPVLSHVPVVSSGEVTADQVNDLLLRVLVSFFLLPPPKKEKSSLPALGALVRMVAG